MAWDDETPWSPSYADCILHLIGAKGLIAARTRAHFIENETLENDPKYAKVSSLFNEQAAEHGVARASEAFAQVAVTLLQQEKRDMELKAELGEEAYAAYQASKEHATDLRQRVANSSQQKADLMKNTADIAQRRATVQQAITGLEAHAHPEVAELSRKIAEDTAQIAKEMQERAVLGQEIADLEQHIADIQAV